MVKSVAEMLGQARASVGFETAAATAEALAEGTALLVDVRQSDEFAGCRIEGSVHAARGLLEFIADPASPRHSPDFELERRIIVVSGSANQASPPEGRAKPTSERESECASMASASTCPAVARVVTTTMQAPAAATLPRASDVIHRLPDGALWRPAVPRRETGAISPDMLRVTQPYWTLGYVPSVTIPEGG